MNQARDKAADQYWKDNNIGFKSIPGVAFSAGWDAALEFLRGKEGSSLPKERFDEILAYADKRYHELMRPRGSSGQTMPTDECGSYLIELLHCIEMDRDSLSALKERIRELEHEKSI